MFQAKSQRHSTAFNELSLTICWYIPLHPPFASLIASISIFLSLVLSGSASMYLPMTESAIETFDASMLRDVETFFIPNAPNQRLFWAASAAIALDNIWGIIQMTSWVL